MLAVHNAWNHEGWITNVVGRIWLIERIVADHIWVTRETSRRGIPVGGKLVVHILLVGEKSTKACHTLLSVVIVGKHLLETVFDQIVSVLVNTVVQVVHITAW